MKMTTEHYNQLQSAIVAKHNAMLKDHAQDYSFYLNAGHSAKRHAWDLLHAAGMTPFVCDTLYKYLNDDHINTALAKIHKELR